MIPAWPHGKAQRCGGVLGTCGSAVTHGFLLMFSHASDHLGEACGGLVPRGSGGQWVGSRGELDSPRCSRPLEDRDCWTPGHQVRAHLPSGCPGSLLDVGAAACGISTVFRSAAIFSLLPGMPRVCQPLRSHGLPRAAGWLGAWFRHVCVLQECPESRP